MDFPFLLQIIATTASVTSTIFTITGMKKRPLPKNRLSWLFLIITLSLSGWTVYSYNQRQFKNVEPKEIVEGKKFFSQRVILDGKQFIDCDFDHCQMVCLGRRPFYFLHNEIRFCTFISAKPEVNQMVKLLEAVGMFKPETMKQLDSSFVN
jgi:hypothetical protein